MKKIASLIIAALIICAVLPIAAVPAFAETTDGVEYCRWNEETNSLETATQDNCVVIDETTDEIGEEADMKWIVVNDVVRIDTIYIYGEANIILAEGGELITNNIIGIDADLHIYGTSPEGKGGTLRFTGGEIAALQVNGFELCGGSVIVEEGYYICGFQTFNDITVHGGSLSVCAESMAIYGPGLTLTGGNIDINAEIALFGELTMSGGRFNAVARSYGICGGASVTGGALDILAGSICINCMNLTEMRESPFSFSNNIDSIHLAVNTGELAGTDGSELLFLYIAGNHDDIVLFEGRNGQWVNRGKLGDLNDNIQPAKEILLLPDADRISDFPLPYADGSSAGSVISDGSLAIIVGVAAAVIFGLGGYFIGKKNKA